MSPEAAPRLLIANLDAEAELSGQPLPRRARQTIAAFGSLLRVLAEPGDHLHLTAPLAAERMVEVPGLARPVLVHGSPAPSLQVLPWCETPRVAQLRRSGPPAGCGSSSLSLHESLWHVVPPPPEVVAAVHRRAFHLRMARRLGCALPGAQILHSAVEFEHHLADGGARASPTEAWVLKAPFSAAGRGRLFGDGVLFDERIRRRAAALFNRYGELLFEPWMHRSFDIGMAGVISSDGPLFLGLHRQLLTPGGAFRGIELRLSDRNGDGRSDGELDGLTAAEERELRHTFDAVADQLVEGGFRGPFGIDGWVDRRATGLHPLGEINARLTFGIIARLFAARLQDHLGWTSGQTLRLRLGGGERAVGHLLLVAPDTEGQAAVWIEMDPTTPWASKTERLE